MGQMPKVGRTVNRDGRIQVVRLNSPGSNSPDFYHSLLVISWPQFLALLTVFYLVLNVLFALAYLLIGDGIANAHSHSFADAFFFSVQTMGTIGYGAMYPQTTAANLIVTLESLMGLLITAMGTGLMFSRFARPTARVMFSDVAVISPHNGVPTLFFRTANQRTNQILEAQLQTTMARSEMTSEGQFMRRFYDLKLLRSATPIFGLSWVAMHPIDEMSPLYGQTPKSLDEIDVEIIISLTGIDETFGQTIHARHGYSAHEIIWNARFADLFTTTTDGQRALDYAHFHRVIPLEDG